MAELRFDITGDSSDAQRANRQYADSAALASRGARLLAESLDKQKRAAAVSAAATIAAAKADRILADAEDDAIAHHVKLRAEQDRLIKGIERTAGPGFLGRLFSGGGAGGVLGGIQGAAGGIPVAGQALGSSPVVAIGAIAAGLATLPFAAAAAAGGIVAAFGGGLTAIGIIAAEKSKQVKAAFADLKADAAKQLAGIGTPFNKALTDILHTADQVLPKLLAPLRDALKVIAPAFDTFGKDLIKAFAGPQVKAAVVQLGGAFANLLKAIGPHLPAIIGAIADGINGIAQAVSAHAKGFATFITFLGDATGAALAFLGALTRVAAWMSAQFLTALHTSEKALQATVASFRAFWHDVASVFDAVRRYIVASWNATWTDTKNIVSRGIAAVVGFFKALPGKILGALFGLGHSLASFASAAFGEMWAGIRNVAGDIWHWLTGWVQDLPGWLRHLLGIRSPSSVMFGIGVNLMAGLERGIKHKAGDAAAAARSAVSNLLVGSGVLGGDPAVNRSLALRMFPWPRTMWGAFNNLVMAESGFNRYATNPSSGAYGIPQALPPTKMPFAAQAAGGSHAGPQLQWMFNYIRQVYGNPVNAWAHEQRFHWYGSGFHGWFDQPTIIGVGERGRERVDITPVHAATGGRGQRIVLQFQPGSEGQLTRALVDVLTRHVRDAGGGDVQVALGTAY